MYLVFPLLVKDYPEYCNKSYYKNQNKFTYYKDRRLLLRIENTNNFLNQMTFNTQHRPKLDISMI